MNWKYGTSVAHLSREAEACLKKNNLNQFMDDPYCRDISHDEWESLSTEAKAAVSTLQIITELEVREEFMSQDELKAMQEGVLLGLSLRGLRTKVNREDDERRQLIQRQRELAQRSRKRASIPRVALASLPKDVSTSRRFKEYVGEGICLIAERIEVVPINDPYSGEPIKFSFIDVGSGKKGLLSWSSLPKTFRQIGR